MELKKFYTIDDIEKCLCENYSVKKYRKLADAYPNRETWRDNYDNIVEYTDGVINDDDYYLFITLENNILEENNGYNEIILQCSKLKNIPDKMFISDAWEKSGKIVSDMINTNITYFLDIEKQSN